MIFGIFCRSIEKGFFKGEKDAGMNSKVKIQKVSRWSICLTLVLTVLVSGIGVWSMREFQMLKNATDRNIECEEAATQLQTGADYLTEQVRMFALSNQGLRDLNKGIAATTLSNLCLIAPVSLLVMVIWELLNVISGQESSMRDHAALFICGTVVMFIIVFLTQWLQYNKTYTVAYKESANRRIVLAEKLRKLPLSFFGQRDLSDTKN